MLTRRMFGTAATSSLIVSPEIKSQTLREKYLKNSHLQQAIDDGVVKIETTLNEVNIHEFIEYWQDNVVVFHKSKFKTYEEYNDVLCSQAVTPWNQAWNVKIIRA